MINKRLPIEARPGLIARNRRDPEWAKSRREGKVMRHALTEVIQRYADHAKSQGSQNSAARAYSNVTRTVYKSALGLGDYREGRDPLAPHALAFVGAAERLAARLLDSGVASGKHYREIYADVRARLKELGAVLGDARFPIFEEVQDG
jgi:hypothetical protein